MVKGLLPTSRTLCIVGLLEAVQKPCVEALFSLSRCVSSQAGPRQLQWVEQSCLYMHSTLTQHIMRLRLE